MAAAAGLVQEIATDRLTLRALAQEDHELVQRWLVRHRAVAAHQSRRIEAIGRRLAAGQVVTQ